MNHSIADMDTETSLLTVLAYKLCVSCKLYLLCLINVWAKDNITIVYIITASVAT